MRREKHGTTVKASWWASSTASRDITCQWGSWSEVTGRRQQLWLRCPCRPCRRRWRKSEREMLSWIVWHKLTTMSSSYRYSGHITGNFTWICIIDDISISVSLHRTGPLCGASVKKTISILSVMFQRIHSSPLTAQRGLLKSSGGNWRSFATKNSPQSLKLVCIFVDMWKSYNIILVLQKYFVSFWLSFIIYSI